MKNLTNSQRLILLIIGGMIIIVVFAIIMLKLTREPIPEVNPKTNENNITEEQTQTENQTNTETQPVKINYNQIVKDINVKIKNNTATATDFIDLGVAYFNLGKPDNAETAYLQAIAKDPNSAKAYSNLANIYRDKRDFVKAEQNYKTSIQLDPQNYKAYTSLAFMYYSLMENRASAINILNQGLIAIPGNQEITDLLVEYNK